MLMNCVRVPSYLLVVFVLDSGIEYYDAFDDNSTLEPILTNTYNGGIILHLDADLNDLNDLFFQKYVTGATKKTAAQTTRHRNGVADLCV